MIDSTKSCDSKFRWSQPGEPWRLLDMLRVFSPKRLTDLGEHIAALEHYYRFEPYYPHSAQAQETAKSIFKALGHYASDFGNETVAKSMRKLAEDIPTDPQLFYFALEQFTDHMEAHRIYFSPFGDHTYYACKDAFGHEVSKAFPSSEMEIESGGDCIAVGQWTASVFHLMRALEPPLIVFANECGVDFKSNWNSALDRIEDAVRNRDNAKCRPNWDSEKDFYIDAVTHFFHIKNAWRNYTMHLRLRYDRDQALEIYNDTRRFMEKLATKLQE